MLQKHNSPILLLEEEPMSHRPASRRRQASLAGLVGLAIFALAMAGPAQAQILLKVNDTINLKFGVLLQPQADWTQLANSTNTDTIGYGQNLFIRRARFLMGGRLAKDVFFFVQTDNPSLGKGKTGTSALGSGFQIYDALGEWRIAEPFILQIGIMRVPYSRESLKGAGSQFVIDTSAYTYLQSTATQSTGGNRDTGTLVRGYFLDKHLEYRAGVFQGARGSGSHNPLRVAGRLQYEFLDVEDMYSPTYLGTYSYPGSYLGDKKVLAAGAGFDTQADYKYYSGDLYASIPAGNGAIEGTIEWQYLNGGVTFTTLPVQNTIQADLGYYFKALKIAPNVRYEQKTVVGTEDGSEKRYIVGLNFYPFKHNFNIKMAYTRIDLKKKVSSALNQLSMNQFTIQLQAYYW
jgi:hypothetical protein